MLNQEVLQQPHLSTQDISRLVKRDYYSIATEVMSLLQKIEAPDKIRVQVAVLKLSEGSLEKLKSYVEMAMLEYWSIVFFAEHPNFYHINNLTFQQRELSIAADWFSYNRWLKKKA